MQLKMGDICNKKECTSCGVCTTVCPQSCITIVNDNIGHKVPFVDRERCISCGICKRYCHNNRQVKLHAPLQCYAMRYQGRQLEKSTSGGISYLLSSYFIKRNGIVYGAAFENGEVSHIRIDDVSKLERIQGSKYVRSIIYSNILEQIQIDTLSGKQVLFTGTACQIAAVKSFMKRDYQNLLYLEILCHGTPPSSYLGEYCCNYVDVTPTSIKFRNKEQYIFEVYFEDKIVLSQNLRDSMYIQGFLHDIILDPSCYNCKYVGEKRVGDIAVGDFWGYSIDGLPCSAVLVNTTNGEKRLLEIIDDCVWIKTKFECIAQSNKPLRDSAKENFFSEVFQRLYPKFGFQVALNVATIHHRIKNMLLKLLRK